MGSCDIVNPSAFIETLFGQILVSALLAVVGAYLLSSILKYRPFEQYFKEELIAIIFGILIFGSISGVLSTFCRLASDEFLEKRDPFVVATSSIHSVIKYGVEPLLVFVKSSAFVLSSLGSIFARPMDSGFSVTLKAFPGATMISDILTYLEFGITVIYASLTSHLLIVQIMHSLIPKFLIPASLLIFLIRPLRKSAIFLLATSIAFYTVYPTIYSVSIKAYVDYKNIEECGFLNCKYSSFSDFGLTYILGNGLLGGVKDLFKSPLLFPLALLSFLPGVSGHILSGWSFSYTLLHLLVFPIFVLVSDFALIAFFIPALSMVLTISLLNSTLSYLLGEY